jgi:hypothetical protein
MLLLRALSVRSYTAIIIGWKEIKLHGYGAENAMKHRNAELPTESRDRSVTPRLQRHQSRAPRQSAGTSTAAL